MGTTRKCVGVAVLVASFAACANLEPESAESAELADPHAKAQSLSLPGLPLGPILGGVLDLLPLDRILRIVAPPAAPPAVCPPPDGTRPDPSLVNTDPFVLARFPLSRVYAQLVARSSGPSASAVDLYQQLWDTFARGQDGKFSGTPHCDDQAGLNGFPIECPRNESVLRESSPDAAFKPVALFNRFDLAPADGSHCGEYRIVYAMQGGSAGRNLIIFEGILPNPQPACGLESCRPVVSFWRSLAQLNPNTSSGQTELANKLDDFYFDGLPGFRPLVHPQHFGSLQQAPDEGSKGQIRLNVFTDSHLWQLREMHLVERCSGGACSLVHQPVSVKNNPFYSLFDPTNTDARAASFQAANGFATQAKGLSADNVNRITMSTENLYNAGQSDAQLQRDDYEQQLGSGPSTFASTLDSASTTPGLGAHQLLHRATTQSCGGCHDLSNNQDLGNGVTWPPSRRFVHVDESGFLSRALWCQFLPARKQVLDGFASSLPKLCLQLGNKLLIVVEPSVSLSSLPNIAPGLLTVAGKATGPN